MLAGKAPSQTKRKEEEKKRPRGKRQPTLPPIPARVFLRHVDPCDARAALRLDLAVLQGLGIIEETGTNNEFVIGPNWGVGVANDLELAQPTKMLSRLRGIGEVGSSLESRVGEIWQSAALRPESDHIHRALEFPRRRDWHNRLVIHGSRIVP